MEYLNNSWINGGKTDMRWNLHDVFNQGNYRRICAEFMGTFTLVFLHAGLSLSTSYTPELRPGQPAKVVNQTAHGIGSGLTLTALIMALGHVSGAHFNPSVSLAFAVKGDFPWLGLVPYVATQVAAAFTAAGVLDAIFPSNEAAGSLGANRPPSHFSISGAFFLELIFSLVLHGTILGTATRGGNVGLQSAIGVGAAIGVLTLLGGGYGGGSMNPARSLAPGVLTSDTFAREHVWIYIAAPMASAVLMGLLMRWLVRTHGRKHEQEVLAAVGEPEHGPEEGEGVGMMSGGTGGAGMPGPPGMPHGRSPSGGPQPHTGSGASIRGSLSAGAQPLAGTMNV